MLPYYVSARGNQIRLVQGMLTANHVFSLVYPFVSLRLTPILTPSINFFSTRIVVLRRPRSKTKLSNASRTCRAQRRRSEGRTCHQETSSERRWKRSGGVTWQAPKGAAFCCCFLGYTRRSFGSACCCRGGSASELFPASARRRPCLDPNNGRIF